jgi:sulfite reductase (NADPH) hemoprotein beta-component
VALPSCGLAMAEAERYLPDLLTRLETLTAAHGLADEPIVVRMTGCPNGCARPYLAEIGLIGKAPGRYNLHLGADHVGQRLNRLYRENVDEAEILACLEPLFARFARERTPRERFGDFLVRAGIVEPARAGREYQLPLAGTQRQHG